MNKKGSTFAIPIEAKIGVSIDKSEVGKFFEKKILKRVAGLKIVCNFAAPNDNKFCCLAEIEFFELMEQYEK